MKKVFRWHGNRVKKIKWITGHQAITPKGSGQYITTGLKNLGPYKEVLRNDILKSKWLWGQKFDHPRVRKSAKGNFAENALPQVMTV